MSQHQRNVALRLTPAEETISLGRVGIRFLVTGAESNGSAALFEVIVPAGEHLPSPTHSHDAFEETIYGLEGVLTWTVDGEQFPVGPGQALCIPRGAVHRFDNFGHLDAKVLATISPAVIGPSFFREVSRETAKASGGPPDRNRLAEILRRHGLTPIPPRE